MTESTSSNPPPPPPTQPSGNAVTLPPPPRRRIHEQSWFWPTLAWGGGVLAAVVMLLCVRYSDSPAALGFWLTLVVLCGLAVACYFAARHGQVVHFVAVALVLPLVLFGVAWDAGTSRVEDAWNDAFSTTDDEPPSTEGDGDLPPDGGGVFDSPSPTPTAPPEPPQPFDGGTYTWSNGVTMTTKVTRFEPWGEREDWCGDGSCGITKPDDFRWVLQYTISVPKDFPERTFDASSCPGELHSRTGSNDDDEVNLVSGDYAVELEKVLAGATKSGAVEYAISKRLNGDTFWMESTCGTTDLMDDETAFFESVIGAS